MRLKYQVFITLLIASGALIATLYAFNSWSFNRGFLNYINDTEIESLQPVTAALVEKYAQEGNWDWAKENRQLWLRLVDDASRAGRRSTRESEIPLPPRDEVRNSSRAKTDKRPRTEPNTGRRPPPPQRPLRLILADENQQLIQGRIDPRRPVDWIPIVQQELIVGYVGYRPALQLPGQLDNIFAAQQKRSFAIASMLMVALCAVLAAVLSSRIVKPVLTVSKAVSLISQGQYDHRVASKRKDELGELSRDVNQLAYTLENSRTARREWIAELSHELRTPVAILQGEIEAIEDGIRPLDLQAIMSLHTEIMRLRHLINDLHDLSLSDIGALEYKMAPLNLLTLIEERVGAAEQQCVDRHIECRIKAPVSELSVTGDQHRLGQLIDNLLQNSLRYTDEGGSIQIDITREKDSVRLVWMDSAPGLSDQQLPRLFDPLFRAEGSRDRSKGGSGLGLTIAQKIVAAHQGQIDASHAALGGLAIIIQLPLNDSVANRNAS